jgi:hypothetical protein
VSAAAGEEVPDEDLRGRLKPTPEREGTGPGHRIPRFLPSLGEKLRRQWVDCAGWIAGSALPTTCCFKGWKAQLPAANRLTHISNENEPVDVSMFRNLRLIPHTKFSNTTVAHIAAISASDVVVAIGGHKKTQGAARAGIALEKPVISLRQFGGAASDLWDDRHRLYAEALPEQVYNVLAGAKVPSISCISLTLWINFSPSWCQRFVCLRVKQRQHRRGPADIIGFVRRSWRGAVRSHAGAPSSARTGK